MLSDGRITDRAAWGFVRCGKSTIIITSIENMGVIMETSTIVSIVIGIATLTLTMIINYFAFTVKISQRVTKLETSYEVFWKVLDPHLAQIIHSPVHTRRDKLVEKLVNNRQHLDRKEAKELGVILEGCLADCTQNQKLAAALLLARLAAITLEMKK